MSRKSRRAGRQHARTLVYAANTRTLGQEPLRNRKRDRPVRRGGPGLCDAWTVDIALALAEAPDDTVERATLRAAMPVDMGTLDNRNGTGTKGRRSSEVLGKRLAAWERNGWLRRNSADDTVTVLDRDALRAYAEETS